MDTKVNQNISIKTEVIDAVKKETLHDEKDKTDETLLSNIHMNRVSSTDDVEDIKVKLEPTTFDEIDIKDETDIFKVNSYNLQLSAQSLTTTQQKFGTKQNLDKHMQTHGGEKTGQKLFECNVCKKQFTHCSSRGRHMRTHTGEKPFQCEICKRKFGSKQHLTEHMVTHTEKKPFECKVCGNKFRQKKSLRIHIRTHTGFNPYECRICEKKFHSRTRLEGHIKTHTGEKLFQCYICENKFRSKQHLERHIRIVHLKVT